MSDIQLLDWDTQVLGLSVARITSKSLTERELRHKLKILQAKGWQLVYWETDGADIYVHEAAQHCAGFLADKKITYSADLTRLNPLPSTHPSIDIYTESSANTELENLAISIGQLSRFGQDPRLRSQQVESLYKAWIHNACKKKVAKIILIARHKHIIVGMIVINEQQGRGNLSLVAVSPGYQGQGIGKRLIYAAQTWCIKQGYSMSQVVTQQTNLKACHLYEHCGFQLEKISYFYHFWL